MASPSETTPSGYGAHACERWAPESAKSRQRGPFERDRARVLHSFALRRLAAKTQVVRAGVSDFPRTRLTHTLECAQIGRELGASLGSDPDLVEAACLAHDLGHPPFGHNGEKALDTAAAPCGGFDGNAQSLRLLTRMESKVLRPDGRSAGLNLTRAALDATLKYPWRRGHADATGKFNCYPDDIEVFDWVRDGAEERRTCVEAQIMDWADDVAYSVHDLEDGLYAGMIRLDAMRSHAHRAEVCALAARMYIDATTGELEDAFTGLLDEPFWPCHLDGGMGSLAALKNLTSELIGRFCRAAVWATRETACAAQLTRYAANLVVPRTQLLECALLKAVAARYVMTRSEVREYQERERALVTDLVEAVRAGAPRTLEAPFRADYERATDDTAALRVVVDQVASLTDTSATAWHTRLVG